MKTMIIFQIAVSTLIFVQNPCFGNPTMPADGMTFSLIEERSKDSPPNVLVTFPDGYTDRLVLRKHNFNEKDRMTDESHCNYIGHLAKETDACVAMTGCLGSDDVELTIMSTHAIGSNGFVWSKEGDVHIVKSNQEINDVLDEDNQDFDFKQSPNLDRSNLLPLTRSKSDDMCYYLKPPSKLKLNVRVAYDERLLAIVSHNKSWEDLQETIPLTGNNKTLVIQRVRAVFAHVQAQFCHQSLGTKIHVNVQNADNPLLIPGYIAMGNSGSAGKLSIPSKAAFDADPTTHLMVYMSGSTGGGRSFTGTPCGKKTNRYSKNGCGRLGYGGAMNCAGIIKHEIGHNLGMGHSTSKREGCKPGGPMGGRPGPWSPCSVMDFRRMYSRFSNDWCLEDYEDACSQKVEDKSITYFQIKNANGYMLELNYNSDSELPDSRAGKTFQFSPNEYKDSQFWYWHQQPNSDYGYIGSKLDVKKVLSIAFSSNLKDNDYLSNAFIIRLKWNQGGYLAVSEDGSVYLNPEKSANTHWEVKDVLDGQIQLKNVMTSRFLLRLKKGGIETIVLKKKVPDGIIWTRHELSQSNQISLKSFKKDYLNSETDKVGSTYDIASEAGVSWTVEIVPICGESGWCEVKDTEKVTDIKDYQMWKLDENLNSIVSKYNHGTIGIDGNSNSILSVYMGDGDMLGAVSVDKTTSSNYDFKFTECPDEPELSPDGTYQVKNSVTEKFLSFERIENTNKVSCGQHKATTCAECPKGNGKKYCNGDCKWVQGQCEYKVKWKFVVATSNSNIGWNWIPKDGTSGVWGFIHHPDAGYLTINACSQATDGLTLDECTLKLSNFQFSTISQLANQLWRKWKNKIISKQLFNKQPVVLTLNSNDNIVAMYPNDDENQDWSLI